MTEKILDHRARSSTTPTTPASVLATSGGRLNPYKLGVEALPPHRGALGPRAVRPGVGGCDDLEAKKSWNLRLGLGKKKIFEVRALYTDVTLVDVFTARLRPRAQALQLRLVEPERALRDRIARVPGGEGQAPHAAHQRRQPVRVRRGRQLREPRRAPPARHDHQGQDLRQDYAREVTRSLQRLWKRPVNVATVVEGKPVMLRHDGKEHTSRPVRP